MQEIMGAALVNVANLIGTIDGFSGPIAIIVENPGNVAVEVTFAKTDNLANPLATDLDTTTTAENTGYTGNASTLNFTGQALNNLPIKPKTVEVKPTAGGNTVNCKDLNGDGILYTSDSDLDVCGTVNYHTGALVLSYPLGKDPNNGDISCDYKYSVALAAKSVRLFKLTSVAKGDRINVYATARQPTTGLVDAQVHVGVFGLNL